MRTKTNDSMLALAAGVLLAGAATSIASADTEHAYNMEGITVVDGQFVYGMVGNYPELEGMPILRIGVRNLEVEFLNDSTIAFCYALDLSPTAATASAFTIGTSKGHTSRGATIPSPKSGAWSGSRPRSHQATIGALGTSAHSSDRPAWTTPTP